MPESLQAPDVEVAEVVVGRVLRRRVLAPAIGVGQVVEEVLAEPADLAAERREVLGPHAQVVDVDVPDVDPVGLLDAEEPEAVEVGEDLLPEVVVRAER